MISQRYAKANNELVGEYNPDQPKTYISDWDANNLYGWAMSQPLPYGKFDWVGPEQWQTINWQHLSDNDYYGYIVECDLDYRLNSTKHTTTIPSPPNASTSKWRCCPMHRSPSPLTTRTPDQLRTSSSSPISGTRRITSHTTATSNSTWIMGCASPRYTE